jgi:hypothetical protein
MTPDNLKLPKPVDAVIRPSIKELLEWRLDPPYLKKVSPDVLINIARVSLQYQSKVKELEANMQKEMTKVLK